MAEAPDRPHGGSGETGSVPAPSVEGLLPAAPPAWESAGRAFEAGDGPGSVQAYRPLSLPALAGFGLAAVYALVVTLGGVFALINHTPLLLPSWMMLLPLAGLFGSWLARKRIRDSEGTLAGAALCSWGVGLSVFFGLSYWAYFAGTYLAVRQQAGKYAEQWIDRLRRGEVEQAFLLTIPASRRPSEKASNLRQELEIAHNQPSPQFTMFSMADYVRLLEMGGPDTQVQPLGVRSWDYGKGGYEVTLAYGITNDLASFNLQVTVHGVEGRAGGGGRQWQVLADPDKGQTLILPNETTFTDEGRAMLALAAAGKGFAQGWVQKMAQGEVGEAYFDTLSATDRDWQRGARQRCLSPSRGMAAGVGFLAAEDDGTRRYRAGRDEFFAGGLVHTDKDVFWALAPTRDEIVQEVKGLFSPPHQKNDHIRLMPSKVQTSARVGDHLLFRYDIQVAVPRVLPRYAVEAQLVLDTDARVTGPGQVALRVRSLDLVRGHSAPGPQPGRPGSGGPLGPR